MTQWLARLEGDEHTLELLRQYLAGTDYRVLKEGALYYIRIAELPDETEPTALQEAASRFIELLNGVARVYFGGFRGVRSNVVVRVRQDRKKEGYGFPTLPERSTSLTLPPIRDGTLETWIAIGARDDLVSRALSLYGSLDHNWRNLYMVLEVIEEDTGGERGLKRTGWVSKRQLDAFKHTANSFRAIGRGARHAKSTYSPPSSPMSLKEAQQLVEGILRRWLQHKAEARSALPGLT